MARLVFVTLIAFALHGAYAQPASNQHAISTSALPAQLVQIIETSLASNNVPGGVVAIVHRNGLIQAGVFGHRDVARSQPLTPETCFRLGSVSKTFTSLLALRLAARGEVDMDRSIATALRPRDPARTQCSQSPTLRQLLEHTSGLPGSSFRDYEENSTNLSPMQLVSGRDPLQLAWCPGLHYAYSNRGYSLAGALIEAGSRATFDSAMARDVFAPLHMTRASFATDPLPGCLSESADASGHTVVSPWRLADRAAGALVAPPLDLVALIRMLLNEGLVDGAPFLASDIVGTLAYGSTGLAPERMGFPSSYGLGQFRFIANGRLWHGHWGRIDGFQTTFGVNRDADVGMIVSINSANRRAMNSIREAVAKELGERNSTQVSRTSLAPRIAPSNDTASTRVVSAIALEARNGWYANASHDMPLRAWLWNTLDVLRIDFNSATNNLEVKNAHHSLIGGASKTLSHVQGHAFRESFLPEATAGFATADDGREYWIDGESYARTHWAIAAGKLVLLIGGLVVFATVCVTVPLRYAYVAIRRRAGDFHCTQHVYPGAFSRSYAIASALMLWVFYAFTSAGIFGGLNEIGALGRPSLLSWSIALASVLGAIAFAAAAIHLVRSDAKPRRTWAWAALMLALIFCARMAYVGWLPLVTWR
jgi:CubicO group peptidase (beta-lactamase class C family)